MAGAENPIFSIDPFWLKNMERIENLRNSIRFPITKTGEEIYWDLFNFSGFRAYPRLHQIIAAFLPLIEFEEVASLKGTRLFSCAENQRIALKSLGIFIENVLKDKYGDEDNNKNFSDYQKFFNSCSGILRKLDKNIADSEAVPCFVDFLVNEIQRAIVSDIRGFVSLRINIGGIRERIRNYLLFLSQTKDPTLSVINDTVKNLLFV